MTPLDAGNIVFQHLIDLPNCDCVFCSTIDNSTGQTRLFLVFHDLHRIYIRNTSKDSWDELQDVSQYEIIRDRFSHALHEEKIPCLST